MIILRKEDITMKNFIDFLYSNIGNRIKHSARVSGSFILISGIVIGMILLLIGLIDFSTNENFGYLISGISTLLGSYLWFRVSRIIYGFGQLVDDVHSMTTRSNENSFEDLPEI